MDPTGAIVFSTVGRAQYGFDIFSIELPSNLNYGAGDFHSLNERCLTDGFSISFNVQFVDDEGTIVYISEKTGSPRIYISRSGAQQQPEQLHSSPESLFHDRPVVKNGRLYFISAHEQPNQPFKSWSALYSTGLNDKNNIQRLTPADHIDYSPAISPSGKLIAVASYGSRNWGGEFHDLGTDIVVIKESDPNIRAIVCNHGGWPTWSDDSTIYFHRQAEDGWWSIYRVDLPRDFDFDFAAEAQYPSSRVTPPGLHCFTPAAALTANIFAVATRRRDKSHRHIEIFDTESKKFYPVTELLHPNSHFYNPAFSPNSTYLGYHRFRGESTRGESTIPYLTPVDSPIQRLKLLRLNGNFPSFSPTGDLIAYNHDFDENSGLRIIKSDGSRRWVLFRNRTTFYNSWSPTEHNVIFTTIGPIFESPKTTVQIARVSFDVKKLTEDSEDIKSNIQYLTDEGTGNNAFPSCSPDGKFIVFRSGRSGHKNLYIIDAMSGEFAGGSVRRLTEGPWIDTMPSWSPDGKSIAFSSNMHNPSNTEAFSLYVIKPDGSGLLRIHLAGVDGHDADRERLNHVCWSADCEWFLFTANLGGVTADPVSLPNQFQPYGDLYTARVDGSGLKRLTWNGYENGTPAWHSSCVDVDVDVELELGRLSLKKSDIGDKLTGGFIEPLWLQCDI